MLLSRSAPVALLALLACDPGQRRADDLEAFRGNLDFLTEERLFGETHRAEFVAAAESETTQAIEGPAAPSNVSSTAVWAGWGHFIGTRDEDQVLDWTGTLSTSTGELTLVRTVKFDRRDQVLTPPDTRTIAFVSRTRPHFDGLIARLDATGGADVTLSTPNGSFAATPSTEPAIQRFDVEGTAAKVALLTVPVPEAGSCPHAVITGRWRDTTNARGNIDGRLVGRWFTPTGELVGHWRAFMGTRSDGSQVVFGKVIDADGNALALLEGTFDASALSLSVLGDNGESLGQVVLGLSRQDATRVQVLGVAETARCL